MEEAPERIPPSLGFTLDNEGLHDTASRKEPNNEDCSVKDGDEEEREGGQTEEETEKENSLLSSPITSNVPYDESNLVFFSPDDDANTLSAPCSAPYTITTTATGAARNGHIRSASHGGSSIYHATPRPSVLKKHGHRRVFSHGQITVGFNQKELDGQPMKGHKRTNSKTEFILPPGHDDRERKRTSLTRSGSAKHHKRQASRTDSLGFSFKGHSRQASRTDSVYTIRTPVNNNNGERLFSFNIFGKKGKQGGGGGQDEVNEVKQRVVVPDHVIPVDVPEHEHPNHKYTKNKIRTTKYTLLWFLPKNLFEQFHRFANLYFLFIVLLNWVPAINAFGKEVSMIPVIFVLGFTAIKDLFEDRRRYQSDKRINNSTCRVYKSSMGRYKKTYWKDVKVGDIVHLSCNEQIPADILLLRSSDEYGLCYIDTQNLDGETNLKQREVPRGFKEQRLSFQPQEFRSTIECDMPTTKIYRFHGSILHPWGERIPVGKDNLLLRECILKNTDYVEGIVVYAGHESKVMLNNGGPRYKRSELERKMNLEVIWCVFILLVLCFIGAVGSGIWLDYFNDNYAPFLNVLSQGDSNPPFEGFLTFWTFVIILQVIIPMSLYVTIEMAKLLQVYLIHKDEKMYDKLCGKRVECRALNIPEELGMVQYIFCDKTGTLTDNKMIFKNCTIRGVDFSHNSSMDKNGTSGRAVIPVNPLLHQRLVSPSPPEPDLLINQSPNVSPKECHQNHIEDFFTLLSVCNTVIVAKYPHRDAMNVSGLIVHSNSMVSVDNHSMLSCIDENADEKSNAGLSTRSPSPPLSFISTSSTEPLKPNSSSMAIPMTKLGSTPVSTRPPVTKSRLLHLLPMSPKPLSPIASSPETSPLSSPVSSRRPKHLQLPSLFAKLKSRSNSSLSKLQIVSTSPTPTEIRPIYEAESPDELALVDAAFAYNCKLLKRTSNCAMISLPNEGLVEFEVLHVLPFDSNRKRMSVVLRHPITLQKILYCKGADASMLPRVIVDNEEEKAVLLKTQTQLDNYAKIGLRVLVMAKKILTETEYDAWVKEHLNAENSMVKREKLLAESYNRIENSFQLIGATGIEDRLQDGVPETIAKLRQAGIVVWVLTGDKQETAINIAYSCQLFPSNVEILTVNARSKDATETTIKYHLDAIMNGDTKADRSLVIDGKTLVYILDKRTNLQKPFLELTSYCASVLCCRATPLQKAFIVRIVKEQLHMKTLAIGDGANDVSMIQTADIGVGISGQEGMQAVMASDFAISRFKYLERLLLVHGHWNYDRLSRMIHYFFYKNATFVFVCFWYQLFCGFSGQVMIDAMYLMLYNLIFTSLPPLAIGVYDQDAPDYILQNMPRLYERGRLGQIYKPYSFWISMADALYQSIVIFFTAYGCYNDTDIGLWEFGTIICTSCLFVMTFHLAVETNSWTIIHWISLIVSIFSYFVFALLYSGVCVNCFGLQVPYWVMQHAMGTIQFWFILIYTSVVAVFPRTCIKALINTCRPNSVTEVLLSRQSNEENKEEDSLFSASSVLRSNFLRGQCGSSTEMTEVLS
ncbi:phospholipid-transporting ATPase VD isoform X2 [Lepeophtheirus salmonis]|uniref:phospholipid-transporting ATPase VD isoform X2 n=1 Tax=Lepeophtheirus salmonis TaxID=72036 RepID=UPI001AEB93A2|nr:phospholipid-transporting ATPase VD-like isoform X2 [Lepeophtheirus salmonis]